MRRALFAGVPNLIELDELNATLDLWLSMWEPHEQECFETALVRSMTDAHPMRIRALSFAACNVIATPRLLAAAARIAERGLFAADDVRHIELDTLPRYKLHDAATRLRGNLAQVEHLIRKAVTRLATPQESSLLDWVDVRDLIAVARTTIDGRIFAEVERRVAGRGPHQRARALKGLDFRVTRSAASSISGE